MATKIDDYSERYAEALEHRLRTPEIDAGVLFKTEYGSGIWLGQLAASDPEIKNEALGPEVLDMLGNYLYRAKNRRELYHFLTPVDAPIPKAPYFLYGAGGTARPRYTARLYDQNAGAIIVSDGDGKVRTAFIQALRAREVPPEQIIKEAQARNYIENAYYSFKLLGKQGLESNGVNVVTESLTALRGKLATEMFAPEGIEVASTPVEIDPDFPDKDPTRPDTWFQTEKGLRNALRELIKLHVWQQAGLITFKPYEPKS